MKAFVLTRHGDAASAFDLQEKPDLKPGEGEITVEVEAFGLNYADIMARKGQYKDAPPLPSVIGYEAAGRVVAVGTGVTNFKPGQRVAAFCRFGGYATMVKVPALGAVAIPEDMDVGVALALTVQYCTAWYCAEHAVTMYPGDHVLVQAAAGGVGTALVQMAKRRGAIVYGTAGSEKKLQYLREQGVDHPINYRKDDFVDYIKQHRGEAGMDVVFDSLGGKEFKRAGKLLAKGGRIVGFGNASRSDAKGGIFRDIGTLLGFGFWSPAFLLMESRAIIGCNMLRVADHRPHVLQHCMQEVVKLADSGEFKPTVGGVFTADQLVEAHAFLQTRKSIGKVIVKW